MKTGINPKKQNIKNPMLNSSVRFVTGTLNHGVHFMAIFSLVLSFKTIINIWLYVKNRMAVEIFTWNQFFARFFKQTRTAICE